MDQSAASCDAAAMDNPLAKYGVWGIWLGSALAIYFGTGWVSLAGHAVFWLTLVAHIVECAVQLPLFRRAGGPLSHHLLQTLIYGIFYWSPIKQRLEAEQASQA